MVLIFPKRWFLAAVAVSCLFRRAYALDPNRHVAQYVYDQWSAATGLPGGTVHAIAQSPDGYLWIGTDKGLVRFDGFNFQSVFPQSPVRNDPILGLITDAEGELWVRMQAAGVLRYRDGSFESATLMPGGTVSQVTAISRENSGGILLSDLISGTLRLRGGKVDVIAYPNVLRGASVTMSMAEMPGGKIWLGTLGAGLFYLADGKATRVDVGLPERKINCLLATGEKEQWVGTDHGLFHWNGVSLRRAGLPRSLGDVQVLTILRDGDSNIWVGTAKGLLRLNVSDTLLSSELGILGNGAIDALFEDREGNLWVGGAAGMERIRDSAFVTFSKAAGLPSETNGPVYVDEESRAWFAPQDGGLYWVKDGRVHIVRTALLDKDVIYSISGRNHEIWLGRQHGGLTRLEHRNGAFTAQNYSEANGLAQNSVYATYQSRDRTVWAGTLSGGVSKFSGGRFVNYTIANGLASNTVTAILETRDGTMWFATPNGLSSLSDGHWNTYAVRDGLPSDDVNCLLEDSSGALWIGTSEGLAYSKVGRVQALHDAPESIPGPILGMAEDKAGWIWIATSNRVLRVHRDKLSTGALTEADVRDYGRVDGLESTEGVKRNSSVVSDSLGRIWFSLARGLSVVDPSHIAGSSAPAIPHIEAISADNKSIHLGQPVRIPSSQKRITFDYTGLSLAVPERIRFRYFLEEFDSGWSQPVSTREAVYTNLGPGSYRFRLVASNSDSMWNGSETSINFKVEPSLWQTWWFRLACVLFVGLATLLVYQFRLRQLTHQLNVRFEERLAERMRIAQELHDTLLQGVLSSSMQLNVANDQLSSDSPAKSLIERVLELMGHVVEDGRRAVRGLRLTKEGTQDLGQAFSRIPQELAVQEVVDFRVIVEGTSRALHPVIRDEVYCIGREAVINAFRHSGAKNIEVELEYGLHELRILIRDDGSGIDRQVLDSGREGHWGLSGMRERAERIGARLKVWSRIASGTEVDLRVPGRVAFEASISGHESKWLPRWYAAKQDREKAERRKRAG